MKEKLGYAAYIGREVASWNALREKKLLCSGVVGIADVDKKTAPWPHWTLAHQTSVSCAVYEQLFTVYYWRIVVLYGENKVQRLAAVSSICM